MSVSFPAILRGGNCFSISAARGEGEEHGCALSRAAFRPNRPVVALNDALDDRESESGAWKLCLGMKSLKRREQLRRIFHVEAGTVISHKEGVAFLANFDLCDLAF